MSYVNFIGKFMPVILCKRCGKPVKGMPVLVNGFYMGKSCASVYFNRMKIRSVIDHNLCNDFSQDSCLSCTCLQNDKCPLELKNNFKIGRKR